MSAEWQFEISRSDLAVTRIAETAAAPLLPGQIRLRIERFAFTANNITYASMGESMGYWQFYPAADAAWGRVPVWGFASIVESTCAELGEGERIYGYWPMGSHVVLTPGRISASSFVESTAGRAKLAAAYNLYTRCAADPAYDAALEDLQALLKPLYVTSFLIDDLLAAEDFFAASQIVISSASSKTAFALAHALHGRANRPRLIGLTAAGNHGFVAGLGLYDAVVPYDALDRIDAAQPTAFVDMAGNGPVRNALHRHCGDNLKFSLMVGLAHRDKRASMEGLPGAKPVLFFAPERLKQRGQDWGRAGLEQRIDAAWRPFVAAARSWLHIHEGHGPQAFAACYARMLAGNTPPDEAWMLLPS
ncbi:DUF2855 family protein [Ferrovibrio sp.]|uniref:DUF2855 family protein n=1 Tax=Ferrovibrio sp. TaxID=1917215 RepID=UPI001B480077|nr:DUF2855 family protein [Ferrovibrio sp.]MBP7063006.1 DUF2855 family protein [Ferrovibrio sp.]